MKAGDRKHAVRSARILACRLRGVPAAFPSRCNDLSQLAGCVARPFQAQVQRTFQSAVGHWQPAKGRSVAALKEGAVLDPPLTTLINVRAAKDQLSSLLEQASQGSEVVITRDGQPKAKLVPFKASRKRFRVDWELLRSMPLKPGTPTAENILREERDGRA